MDQELERLSALTERIIGCAITVHKALGPGLLESAYRRCLALELRAAGLHVAEEVPVGLEYRGEIIHDVYRMDLIVEGKVIVEVKAVEHVVPVFQAQLLTYMRLTRKRVGLILNFNTVLLKDGIVRRVL